MTPTAGVPDSRPLQGGDLLNVDVTAYLNGYHGDTNATFCVGELPAWQLGWQPGRTPGHHLEQQCWGPGVGAVWHV